MQGGIKALEFTALTGDRDRSGGSRFLVLVLWR